MTELVYINIYWHFPDGEVIYSTVLLKLFDFITSPMEYYDTEYKNNRHF